MIKKFLKTFKDSYIQTFSDNGSNPKLVRIFPMKELAEHHLDELNSAGAGIFFTPNPCKKGRKEENVTSIDWVYVDMDNGTKAEMQAKIESAPIRPHIIIESKRSYHLYWKVGMMDRKEFDKIIQGLIEFFDGDPAISSTNEVLRFPGFNHMKNPKEPFKIKIIYFFLEPLISPQMLEGYPSTQKDVTSKLDPIAGLSVDVRSTNEIDKLKQIPILDILQSFGVEVNKQNFILEKGEVTSASVNIEKNYINRFSGKDGSGTTIDACMAYGKMDTKEAIDYLKAFGGYDVEKIIKKPNPTVDKIDDINDNPFTWGTDELDKKISPIEKNHYNVFAGETASGKSAFCFDMAVKNANLGHKVLYLTLEMSTDGVYTRVAREYAGITKELWRKKSLLSEGQLSAYKRRKKELMEIENLVLIGITDNPPIEKIHEVIKKIKPDLTFIDNFDKIGTDNKLHEVQAQTEVSAKILAICESTPTPIVVIHHLKKGSDDDLKKPRTINSLRGSGKIGHDAYTVVLGFRVPFKDDMTTEEKAKFTVIEIKDREFGIGGYHICYFRKGTFEDKFIDETINYVEQIFNTKARQNA